MRACSALTVRVSNSPENHPDTRASLCFCRMGPRTAASIGNLAPVSGPEKPALRLSRRQVSSVVSPPSCGRSLFDQAIGATPKRMGPEVGMSDADPLPAPSARHVGTGGAHLLPLA